MTTLTRNSLGPLKAALRRTANHIERKPQSYNFYKGNVPASEDCGTPSCPLAWLGYFRGYPEGSMWKSVCEDLLGIDSNDFNLILVKLAHELGPRRALSTGDLSPSEVAAALRELADRLGTPRDPRKDLEDE